MSSPDQAVVFLTIPGLRRQDLSAMPNLTRLFQRGPQATLRHSFPAVTWPAQATLLTGRLPNEHGVIANGFYWRDERRVEMWTAWNERIEQPQIWDLLHQLETPRTSLAWFPMLSKGSGADYICMPAPIHQPDGSEDLWCYTRPQEFYGELLQKHGHFPLQHFWGPLANIKSSAWIGTTAAEAAARFQPDFSYIYLPHLDYAAQRSGPDSPPAQAAVAELDEVIGKLVGDYAAAFGETSLIWFAASEYVITEVDHVTYPNRLLREAGLLQVQAEETGAGEVLNLDTSQAWALVDHQFSHVFLRQPGDPETAEKVRQVFAGVEGIDEVLVLDERRAYHLDHARAGDVVLVSSPNSWQAYYWWQDDARAPSYARTVDIHRKPGYDPVELFFDPATRSVPLEPERIHGSHGARLQDPRQAVLLCSRPGVLPGDEINDTEVCDLLLKLWE